MRPLRKNISSIRRFDQGGVNNGEDKVSNLLDTLSSVGQRRTFDPNAPGGYRQTTAEDVAQYVASQDPNYGQRSIEAAEDYHKRRLDSPIYREQLSDALFRPGTLDAGRARALRRSIREDMGLKDVPSDADAIEAYIHDHVSNRLFDKILRKSLSKGDPSDMSRKDLRSIFKNLPLKDRPLTKKGKSSAAGEILEEGKSNLIDQLINYRKTLIDENPTKVKVLKTDRYGDVYWTPDQPWRPEGFGQDPYTRGKYTRGLSADPRGGGNPNLSQYHAPFFMGPEALKRMQQRHKPSNILAQDPFKMKQVAVEEIGHTSDPYRGDVLPQTNKLINDLFEKTWEDEGGFTEEEMKERVSNPGFTPKHLQYLRKPTEVNQRLERVRSHLFDYGIDILNEPIDLNSPDVQAALKDLEGSSANPIRDLRALFRDKDIETLLNKAP
jgi:hypothetical protein